MDTVRWEKVCYKILADYESKCSQIKHPLFNVFGGLHEFRFSINIFMFMKQSKDSI